VSEITMYCPWCASSNLTPVYAADGVTIRYYRCGDCGLIVRNPVIITLAAKQNATE
jgi:uncharacterized Zn finger protein